MRCIIIDNDNSFLELVKNYIVKIPFLQLDGSFNNPFEAMDYLAHNRTDLIFTEIEMENITGVQLISSLKNRPMVIFITAHEQYAIDGFNLDAIDYILKPLSFERFLKGVNKAFEDFTFKNQKQTLNPKKPLVLKELNHLFVKTENRLVRIKFEDILYVEGFGDYIKLHLPGDKIVLSLQNLGTIEGRLPMMEFVRVHRSFIVSIEKIDSIERRRIKIGKETIPISESYSAAFFNRIND
ncbi:MAG: LytTR family DNA-binding domain-containing protein [Bacteroidales bacterium]|nr:LytTR family DNA-binding domain-containing protein [Bacteroidales bacterium]